MDMMICNCVQRVHLDTTADDAFTVVPDDEKVRVDQRTFLTVHNVTAWLNALDACNAFDAANTDAVVPHREAIRLISYSQVGAGAFFARTPDVTVKGTAVASTNMRIAVQRRYGLYISSLTVVLTARAGRGIVVTQAERLGDRYINNANNTPRHNAVLRAIVTAIRCASPPGKTVSYGDKGDGTPASIEEAKRRYAHLNEGHVPDAFRVSDPTELWEIKCITPFHTGGTQGNSNEQHLGVVATKDGFFIAFGNTEENQRIIVYGCQARGAATERPFNRETGVGRVAARPGHYTDALGKKHVVVLAALEISGAMNGATVKLFSSLAKLAASAEGDDSTFYGTGRGSPQDFFSHHVAMTASAAVLADADVIVAAASRLARELTRPV